MNLRPNIDLFLNEKHIGIAHVSRNTKNFGGIVAKTLIDQGYHIYPVNSFADEIAGMTCFKSIDVLPLGVKNLFILTNKRDTEAIVKDAIQKGIKNIWIQNGCETPEAINTAKENNVNLVSGACILMYANPQGFHKFHQTIFRWTGKFHK